MDFSLNKMPQVATAACMLKLGKAEARDKGKHGMRTGVSPKRDHCGVFRAFDEPSFGVECARNPAT